MARLPAPARFGLVVLSSFGLSAICYSLISTFTSSELAAVSRNLTDGWQIASMVAWKLIELSIAWSAGFDYLDLTYLTLINQVPHYFLLNTFFGIDYLAALLPLGVDVLTIALPFALMRNLNKQHVSAGKKTDNELVAEDKGVQWSAGILGSSIYALIIFWSFSTKLPVFMITHFDGVRSLEKVHSTALLNLLGLFAPLGFAASQFIFVPALATRGNPSLTDENLVTETFDPKTASLGQTVASNLRFQGGFTPRAHVIAKRTATLAVFSAVHTFVRSYFTIEGTDLLGALGWSALWGFAAASTGVAYAWVGNE